MSLDYLKVKILSLTEEAKIIRRMEAKRKQQATFARDMVNVERRVAYHKKQIARLQDIVPEDEVDEDVLAMRIQWHELEIKRLQRQASRPTNHPITVEDVAESENVYQGLHLHRVNDVRKEARSAYLAYGFLRGLAYQDMEEAAYTQPNWLKIKVLVLKYGTDGDLSSRDARFEEWKKKALNDVPEKHIETSQPRSKRGQFWDMFKKFLVPA